MPSRTPSSGSTLTATVTPCVDGRHWECLASIQWTSASQGAGESCARRVRVSARACAAALAEEGVAFVINGRDAEKLEKTAADLRNLPGIDREVVAVAADITTDAGRAALLAACPDPDILVLNNRGPKPGILADQTAENFEEALTLHFRTPLALLMAVLPGMKERGWGRIVCITSAMVTAPRRCRSRAPVRVRHRRR